MNHFLQGENVEINETENDRKMYLTYDNNISKVGKLGNSFSQTLYFLSRI